MKKNLNFTIIAVVLAIATIAVGVLLIMKNTGDTIVSLGSAKGISGDVVEIPLSIENNKGMWGGQILIDYDSDNLSFVSMENGTVFEECIANDTGDCLALLVTQSKLENSSKNGDIATLKFKIKVSADDGVYNLDFNKDTNFCNAKEEMIEPDLNGGKITVK